MFLKAALLVLVVLAAEPAAQKVQGYLQSLPPQFSSEIPDGAIDYELLDAAVTAETNKRRNAEKLPALAFDDKAYKAAVLHSEALAEAKRVSHVNDTPGIRTFRERMVEVGMSPRLAGENVGMMFMLRIVPGLPVSVSVESGKQVLLDDKGVPLKNHSYESAAAAAVDEWMKSTDHRSNILHTDMRRMGAACRTSTGERGLIVIYCTEVFFG